MHELTVAQGMLDTAMRHLPHPQARVTRVTMMIGSLTGVVEESLRFAFAQLVPGTPLAGADLVIGLQHARLTCTVCGQVRFHENGHPLEVACGACGGLNRLEGGRELFLKDMEVEDEDRDPPSGPRT